MLLPTRLTLCFALMLWASLVIAQNNLGELLDAGARMLSVDEFKEGLVQRVIVGPTPSGGNLEIMYATNGEIQGRGIGLSSPTPVPVSGEWKIGDSGKICSSMRLGGTNSVVLPSRCQSWFKLGDQYFLSDSDSDRYARVLRRTVKQ